MRKSLILIVLLISGCASAGVAQPVGAIPADRPVLDTITQPDDYHVILSNQTKLLLYIDYLEELLLANNDRD